MRRTSESKKVPSNPPISYTESCFRSFRFSFACFFFLHNLINCTSFESPKININRKQTGVLSPSVTRPTVTTTMSSRTSDPIHIDEDGGGKKAKLTILGFGSLLSERSSRTTFPNLENFRLGRVPNYRRVFRHPASIFFQRGIANLETIEISSLCAEPCEGHGGFVCSIFEVPNDDMMEDGVPSMTFLEREEEFNIIEVPYIDLSSTEQEASMSMTISNPRGVLCTSSSDEEYIKRWGKQRFEEYYAKFGLDTIWGWEPDSGLRPCAVYLRHCYLAAKSMGEVCFNSFLDETFLIDRKTTIREYIQTHPEILETYPPPALIDRYSG